MLRLRMPRTIQTSSRFRLKGRAMAPWVCSVNLAGPYSDRHLEQDFLGCNPNGCILSTISTAKEYFLAASTAKERP